MTETDLTAVLAAIDDALAPVCGWRQARLDPAAPSPDFCEETCQQLFLEHQTDPLVEADELAGPEDRAQTSGRPVRSGGASRQRRFSPLWVPGTVVTADHMLAALAGGRIGLAPARTDWAREHRQVQELLDRMAAELHPGPDRGQGAGQPVRTARVRNRQPDPVTGLREVTADRARSAVALGMDGVAAAAATRNLQRNLAAMMSAAPVRLSATVARAIADLAPPPPPPPPRSALVRAWSELAPTAGQLLHHAGRIVAAIVGQLADEVRSLRLVVRAVHALARRRS
ncbi:MULTISPECIES: hypothetical protein [unclassified Crossiella]|uniref:hypothetical protein n=1 Tax=unclassified Crossiella TaxID=2620835 RepID=UPI001FFE4194|nr:MULTISPECIES: hypothetical protein [unclassified Crossiella]MCK2242163.1 hypothetical protein [Crossiella sp. S99.2]MCK2256066.1 hypothetical protein [Crossiella sp. S99.1]